MKKAIAWCVVLFLLFGLAIMVVIAQIADAAAQGFKP